MHKYYGQYKYCSFSFTFYFSGGTVFIIISYLFLFSEILIL